MALSANEIIFGEEHNGQDHLSDKNIVSGKKNKNRNKHSALASKHPQSELVKKQSLHISNAYSQLQQSGYETQKNYCLKLEKRND